MSCAFIPSRLTHIGLIASNMRPMDRIECEALGRTPKTALRAGLRCSLEAFTAVNDRGPQAMMGVVPASMLEGRGTVWMLGTEAIYDYGRDLLAYGPLFIDRWLETFRSLENIVASDNAKAVRLLEHWGFDVDDAERLYRGVAFRSFRIERAAIQALPMAA